jgi:LasA protease
MVATAPAYASASGTVVDSQGLNIRTCASTTLCPVVGSLSNGTGITIVCQLNGDPVNGNWGQTSIWDRITPLNQPGRYVSDGFVDTGSNGYVTDGCAPG